MGERCDSSLHGRGPAGVGERLQPGDGARAEPCGSDEPGMRMGVLSALARLDARGKKSFTVISIKRFSAILILRAHELLSNFDHVVDMIKIIEQSGMLPTTPPQERV